jgi:two-component system, chemotaxis family, CheB/CheR fusion protein
MASEQPNADKPPAGRTQPVEEPATLAGSSPPDPAASRRAFPVVGIGASAGGLEAFKKFFAALPATSGMAFVAVPHLDPTHKSLMVELLARQTTMPVREATQGLAVEPNTIYVIPPGQYLAIHDGRLELTTPDKGRGQPPAIDFFFRSLAADQQERAIGIVLSGTSSQGTQGLKEIKAVGGMVMVQEPSSAEYEQMPRSAIAAGVADYVLPPAAMPAALVKFVQLPYLRGADAVPLADAQQLLQSVLSLLRTRTKSDFRGYRKHMLLRRVQRRMGLCHVDDPEKYLQLLRDDSQEVAALHKDLLIGVTAFFREPEAFEVLQQLVIPELIQRADGETPIRVWVPGCATGEEAYSLAMLLWEGFAAANKAPSLQIFATDRDEEALHAARQGIYLEAISAEVSPERLRRFFVRPDEHHYQANKQLRESVVFAPQNLISDAPFSNLDLISCRNLLIYLEPEVQRKVMGLFHFALRAGGYLVLGPSESVGREMDLFEPISKKWRVFRRLAPARRGLVEFPIIAGEHKPLKHLRPETTSAPAAGFTQLMQKLLLADFAPAAALINRNFEILSVQGPLANYLEFPPGELTKDLLAMARQGLRVKIRAAVQRAVRDNRSVSDDNARVKRDIKYVPCTITVKPIHEPKEADGLLLVTLVDRAGPPASEPPEQQAGAEGTSATGSASEEREEAAVVRQLEYELKGRWRNTKAPTRSSRRRTKK